MVNNALNFLRLIKLRIITLSPAKSAFGLPHTSDIVAAYYKVFRARTRWSPKSPARPAIASVTKKTLRSSNLKASFTNPGDFRDDIRNSEETA